MRIAIIGPTCAGKTTLARRRADLLELPHIELDSLHWEPNWTPVAAAELRRRVEGRVRESWIVDRNYLQRTVHGGSA